MVLRTRRLSGNVLPFLLSAEDATLREHAESAADGRAAKTLVKEGPLRITMIALRKGATMESHEVAGPSGRWKQLDAARRPIAEPGPFRPQDRKGRLPE